jgi:hypothetical protein
VVSAADPLLRGLSDYFARESQSGSVGMATV